jgi:hypothetical protein
MQATDGLQMGLVVMPRLVTKRLAPACRAHTWARCSRARAATVVGTGRRTRPADGGGLRGSNSRGHAVCPVRLLAPLGAPCAAQSPAPRRPGCGPAAAHRRNPAETTYNVATVGWVVAAASTGNAHRAGQDLQAAAAHRRNPAGTTYNVATVGWAAVAASVGNARRAGRSRRAAAKNRSNPAGTTYNVTTVGQF